MLPYVPLCTQGLWERELSWPGEADYRLLHRGKQTFHRGSLLQVATHFQCSSRTLPLEAAVPMRSFVPGFNFTNPRTLAACSKDGADPYVTFVLLPDKKATTKRRTATKKRDLNPEFNERWAGEEEQSRQRGKSFFFFCNNAVASSSIGSTLILLWRSPSKGGWTCRWRTACPSWAERGSSSGR